MGTGLALSYNASPMSTVTYSDRLIYRLCGAESDRLHAGSTPRSRRALWIVISACTNSRLAFFKDAYHQ
jgi:hypothetical protein